MQNTIPKLYGYWCQYTDKSFGRPETKKVFFYLFFKLASHSHRASKLLIKEIGQKKRYDSFFLQWQRSAYTNLWGLLVKPYFAFIYFCLFSQQFQKINTESFLLADGDILTTVLWMLLWVSSVSRALFLIKIHQV